MGNKTRKMSGKLNVHTLSNKREASTSISQLSQTTVTTTLPQALSLPDGVTIVWLDARASSDSDDDHSTKVMLYKMQSSVLIFNDVKNCLDSLNTITNKKARIFLVLSGKFGIHILSGLKKLSAIDSIFIFCAHSEKYEHLLNEYSPHLIGVFSQQDELETYLQIELNHYHMRAPVFNFFAQKQSAVRDLTYDAASFLWFQLLQKKLIETHFDQSDMEDMLDYCQKQYARNDHQQTFLSDIDEFRDTYRSTDAIKWYTRQSFVYKLVNSALRTGDIEALYIFRFYISDLCRQLANEHKTFRTQYPESPILKLYRGCHMTLEELGKLQDSIGDMISINGFISTSRRKLVADVFLSRDSRRVSGAQKVLWIIQADCSIDDVIFASVAEYSEHSHEQEVLFNIGSAFRIDSVKLNKIEDVWHVEATTTNAGSRAVSEYIELTKRDLNQTSEKVIFGTLFMDMGKYLTAQRYFEDLIQRFSGNNYSDLAAFHYNMGLTYIFQEDLGFAEKSLVSALHWQQSIPSKQRDVARTLNALGWVYQDSGDLSKAISLYREAEAIGDKYDDMANVQTYTYMGKYYLQRQEYDDSNKYYQYALKILDRHLLTQHQRYGIILNEMGDVSRKRGDSEKALKLYQQAEIIFQNILSLHHPCMAYCWSTMGFVFLQMKDIENAQFYHRKALKSYQHVLPSDHMNIEISEKNIKCTSYDLIMDCYAQICAQV